MDRYIGRLLDGRYEILEVIGTGGMAVVYKARCHRLNRLVAIKILRDENLQDDDFRRRFHAEGQAVGMLSHPNIVSVYDVSTVDGVDYIVMELVEGITLKQYMEKKGVLNWKETLHFATQIAKALDHAHSRGLVHRDIKPHNVMVLKNGSVCVTDFGIARIMSETNTLTKEALGSVHYISPEQAKGGRVDHRSDLYSLGVVMYEMITGRPPYDGESPVSVAIQHIAGGAVKPSKLNPNIPAGLEQIILRAMAHDLKDRYASALEMIADMDELRKNPEKIFPALPVRTPVKTEKPKPEPRVGTDTVVVPIPDPKMLPPKPAPKREETDKRRGRITTIAIISCCAAILVAAIILLVLLANGSLFQNESASYQVPYLVNMYFDRVPEYKGLQVVRQDSAYSDSVPEGCIVSQMPDAGTMVEEGRTIYVIVSLGPKPPDVLMPDVAGKSYAEAMAILKGLNLELQIEVKEEYSDTVEKNAVVSTSILEGAVLHRGQRVELIVSLGREILKAEMPNLLRSDGITKENAEKMLNLRGFSNVTWVPVESFLPAGIVVSQSVEADTLIDITTSIIIEYSNGVRPVVTIPYTFDLSDVYEKMGIEPGENFLITIMQGDKTVVQDVVIEYGSTTYTAPLTGRDSLVFKIYVNWNHYKDVTVEFV